jgi:SAM-dependent methyltransferase
LNEQFVKTNEGIRVKWATKCLLCDCEGERLYHDLRDRLGDAPGVWENKYCPKDHLIWLDPQPVSKDIGKLYSGYELTHSIAETSAPRLMGLRKTIRRGILATAFGYRDLDANWFEKITGRVCSWFGPLRDAIGGMVLWLDGDSRGRLLDVGCGNGENVAYLKDLGWRVTGIETDPIAADLARTKFGLEVYEGNLEDAKFPDESFDAITLAHVIEHLPDPIKTLKECFRILKPGGKIVLITPNNRSLGQNIFRDDWLYLDPPRHLFIFSPLAIKVCLEEAGFCSSKIRSATRNAAVAWIGSKMIHQNRKLFVRKLLENYRADIDLACTGFMFIEIVSSIFMNSGEELILKGTKYKR